VIVSGDAALALKHPAERQALRQNADILVFMKFSYGHPFHGLAETLQNVIKHRWSQFVDLLKQK
jgi:hypothetical protein